MSRAVKITIWVSMRVFCTKECFFEVSFLALRSCMGWSLIINMERYIPDNTPASVVSSEKLMIIAIVEL